MVTYLKFLSSHPACGGLQTYLWPQDCREYLGLLRGCYRVGLRHAELQAPFSTRTKRACCPLPLCACTFEVYSISRTTILEQQDSDLEMKCTCAYAYMHMHIYIYIYIFRHMFFYLYLLTFLRTSNLRKRTKSFSGLPPKSSRH